MQIVYVREEIPESFDKAIFLAGPTPRSADVKSWRPEALRILEDGGYNGIVFVPEGRDEKREGDYISQVDWEERCLNMADCILFWVPREIKTMPALTTNIEWGAWCDSGKAVFGAPPDAVKVSYQKLYADKFQVPAAATLKDTIDNAVKMVGNGALRVGGEREVPLYIWNTSHFKNWYNAQKQAGNRLDGAKVAWTFRVGPQRNFVFLWALHVNVYIAKEDRNKTN